MAMTEPLIHLTALVDPKARLGAGVKIGAYAVVGAEVELTKSRGKICRAFGVCRVKNEIVSEAELMFGLIDT